MTGHLCVYMEILHDFALPTREIPTLSTIPSPTQARSSVTQHPPAHHTEFLPIYFMLSALAPAALSFRDVFYPL